MKEIIVKAIPYEKKLVTFSLESGVDAILVEEKSVKDVTSLSRIATYTPEDFVKNYSLV